MPITPMKTNLKATSTFLIALSFLTTLTGCFQDKASTSNLQKSEESQALYALGQMYARNLQNMNLTESEVDLIQKGFKDWVLRHKSEMDYDQGRAKIQKLIDDRMTQISKTEKEKGRVFLEAFLKSGGLKTSSGLAYKIHKPGNSKKPKESNWVEVHYQGARIDGQVFDSSLDRNQKAKFPLNQIIRGWKEGLQLIGEGGEIELVVPSELAYGDRGSGANIPPGATLVFKIQLFKVN